MKSILITNQFLNYYRGSELETYTHAITLQEMGWDVTVATFTYGPVFKKKFDKYSIPLINLSNASLDKSSYDVMWLKHHPTSDNVLLQKKIISDTIIYNSLSPIVQLELPPRYINDLSLCCCNSKETRDRMLKAQVLEENLIIMPNSVPSEVFNMKKKLNSSLQRICIISNHPTSEEFELQKLCKANGIIADLFGLKTQSITITPELLLDYDLIITIGRTIQYALALGIPAYCYDHFGGPGYITPKNWELLDYYNYSGRKTRARITEKALYSEIVNEYEQHLSEQDDLIQIAKSNYVLENNLNKVLELALARPAVNCEYIQKKYTD